MLCSPMDLMMSINEGASTSGTSHLAEGPSGANLVVRNVAPPTQGKFKLFVYGFLLISKTILRIKTPGHGTLIGLVLT